jgi:hypothetical protein
MLFQWSVREKEVCGTCNLNEGDGLECVDWIYLAEDSFQFWALVNTVMELSVP